MTQNFVIKPETQLIDKSGRPTRDLFLLLTYLNNFTGNFASLVVEDAITNGVLDMAPSENAVFDALALKANASSLSAYLTTVAAALAYQPLDSQLSTLAALADAAGALTNDGAGNFTWSSSSGASISLGTKQDSTSGSAIDFTGLVSPKLFVASWAGLSTTGTGIPLFQLGASGGIEATGYLGASSIITSGVGTANFTTGIGFSGTTWTAATTVHGAVLGVLLDPSANTWAMIALFSNSGGAQMNVGAYSKSLSGTMDRMRFSTADAFDAGKINYLALA